MKSVVIDKLLELDESFDRIDDISCIEKLQTTATSEGLECTGNIEVKGMGVLNSTQIPVEETIDVSIFAPFHRLSDSEQFRVALSDAQFHLDSTQLNCRFIFDVSGLAEENQIKEIETEEGSIEDLLDDSDVVFEKVRYVLAEKGDTYTSLASRYHVNEASLRRLNQDKLLHERSLILLPFC